MHTQSVIDRYFQLAPSSDTDAYFAQFDVDATVEDEGHEHHGIDAIRAWRSEVPTVSYEVRDVSSDGAGHVARALIAGDFPGSPVELVFHFAFTDDGLIESLRIRT
jgi:SnoaL-like protein